MISVYILAAAVSLLLLALCRAEIKKLRLATKTWEELVRELKPVRTEGITLAALECSDASGWQPGIDPDELWTMIGGWDGLKQMQTNTEVLVALASQAKVWNLGGSTLVAKRMQSEAIDMRRAAMRLKIGRTCGYGRERAAVYVQECERRSKNRPCSAV